MRNEICDCRLKITVLIVWVPGDGEEVGILHGHLQLARLLVLLERPDEVLGHAGELCLVEQEEGCVLVEVLVKLHPELGDPLLHRLNLLPLGLVKMETVPHPIIDLEKQTFCREKTREYPSFA